MCTVWREMRRSCTVARSVCHFRGEGASACTACRYITRQVIAISNATAVSGIPRTEWDTRVKLSAAKRLVEQMGLGTSVWGHASARMPETADRMLLAAFGESFGEATASSLRLTPTHPDDLGKEGRDTTNVTAVVLHGAVYSQRPDAGCVLHTHSPHCTALAASSLEFDAEIIQVRVSHPRARSLRSLRRARCPAGADVPRRRRAAFLPARCQHGAPGQCHGSACTCPPESLHASAGSESGPHLCRQLVSRSPSPP